MVLNGKTRYAVWRSDAPTDVVGYERLGEAYGALRAAMAACGDRSIEWRLVRAFPGGRGWETLARGRAGDLARRTTEEVTPG